MRNYSRHSVTAFYSSYFLGRFPLTLSVISQCTPMSAIWLLSQQRFSMTSLRRIGVLFLTRATVHSICVGYSQDILSQNDDEAIIFHEKQVPKAFYMNHRLHR